MDQQTKLIILSVVAGMVVMGVVVFLWSSIRAIKSASRRKFGREKQETSSGCNCPPHQSRYCVPARVHVPDSTPVAIYGVRTDEGCGDGGSGALTQAQVQHLVDRANKLRALKAEQALDELLGDLRVTPSRTDSRSSV
jgi:hypothetical protein